MKNKKVKKSLHVHQSGIVRKKEAKLMEQVLFLSFLPYKNPNKSHTLKSRGKIQIKLYVEKHV